LGRLADNIRQAVREERYVFGAHADQRLRERGIVGWQVAAGMDTGTLILERPDAIPNPAAEFDLILADGTPIKAVWAWIAVDRTTKLVTVHFYDR
jgi:hypothetical protein